MLLLVHGEVTDPDVDVFDREAVFIERVLAPLVARFPGAQDRVRARHDARSGRSSSRARARTSPRRSRRSTCSSTATRCSPAASGRTPTACRCQAREASPRAARGGDLGHAQVLPRHRQRAARARAPRRAPAAAPASSTRRSRSKAMPRCSRRPARSTGSRASRPSIGAAFYGLPLNEGTVTLERSGEVPGDDRRRRAVPRRRDASLAARRPRSGRCRRWPITAPKYSSSRS